MISAQDALTLLREGNQRFVSEAPSRDTVESRARRLELAKGQEPFAAILGCSDSRVPVEIIFDQASAIFLSFESRAILLLRRSSAAWSLRLSNSALGWS